MNLIKKRSYFKQVLFIATPTIIQGIVMQLQALISKAFLGSIKTEYLSSIGNAMVPYFFTLAVIFSISTGLTIVVSRNIGYNKFTEISQYFESSVFFNTIMCMGLFLLWYFFSEYIFLIIGVNQLIINYCIEYMRILAFSFIFLGYEVSLQSTLQGLGITKPIMYSGILKVAIQILLDWILILGNLGFPSYGITGAAISALISNVLAIIFMTVYVIHFKCFNINIFNFKNPYWSKYKHVIKIGLPTGFENVIWNIGNIILIKTLNDIDVNAVGIFTLTCNIESLVFMFYNGIAISTLTLVGQKIGANNKKEAKAIVVTCIRYNVILISIFFVIFLLFSKDIISIFVKDFSFISGTSIYLIITSIILFPKSINSIVGSGIRGIGNTKWMMFTQLFGTGLIIFMCNLLVYNFTINITAIYLIIFIDEILRVIINVLYFVKTDSSNNSKIV
jgi:putative MATE family efflux protein